MQVEILTMTNKVGNDSLAFCCALSDMRPETGHIQDAEKKPDGMEEQLGIKITRLVKYEVSGNLT